MAAEVAAANVSRCYQLAASCIAIFTFLLFFLYPRFVNGDVDGGAYQTTLIVMGIATFSFAFASFYYYRASLTDGLDEAWQPTLHLRADYFWLSGCVMLFLAPSMVLFTVKLFVVASAWFALWFVYVLFLIRNFPALRPRN